MTAASLDQFRLTAILAVFTLAAATATSAHAQDGDDAPAAETATETAAAEPATPTPAYAVPPANPTMLEPLGDEARALFGALRADPDPDATIRDNHYWISNETAHWVWYERIRDLGGIFVGVGTDQNYLMAGWSRPEVLVLLDFDQDIVDFHRAYEVAFLHSATYDEFYDLWWSNQEHLRELIVGHYPDPAVQADILSAVERGGNEVRYRLRVTRERFSELGIPTFVTDQDQYTYVRELYQTGRVYAVRGDLTADTAMLDLAYVSHHLDLPVRVLYLSNCEQYYDYEGPYRRNILAQLFDERSVVLRTAHSSVFARPEGEPDYHFNIQGGTNYAAWLRHHHLMNMWYLLRRKEESEIYGLTVIERLPDEPYDTPTIAPIPADHPLADVLHL